MEAFTHLAPDAWTLRDVILALRYRERILAVLASSSETRPLIGKFMNGSTTDRDIIASANKLAAMGFARAA